MIPRPGRTPATSALDRDLLDALARDLYALRERLLGDEGVASATLARVHPVHQASARNLAHYLALRAGDIQPLQERLSRVGLTSLGRCEPHVLMALERCLAMLGLARGKGLPDFTDGPPPVGFREGPELLYGNANRLLGPRTGERHVRIVVTLPSEAAEDPGLVDGLLAEGMDVARINCAHDHAEAWAAMIRHVRAAAAARGRACRVLMDLGGPKIRTGAFAGGVDHVRLHRGELLRLLPGPGALPEGCAAALTCTEPAIFRGARTGDPIWFDDGRLGGEIVDAGPTGLTVRLTQAPPKGHKLKPEKGINLPGTDLDLPALTDTDRADLRFVAAHADMVALSFVNRPSDVAELYGLLDGLSAEGLRPGGGAPGPAALGVVLKIETAAAFRRLPALLLEAMRREDAGLMIARGDLAVESGFVRLATVQEEILRIAEAAHLPVIWATQVLENLAKTGLPSRAEVTDAASAVRAEAVMLNKGPFITDAVRVLEDILVSVQPYQTKKRQWLPRLSPEAGG